MRRSTRRFLALAVTLLLVPLAGCVELKAARVPLKLLEGEGGNGWAENFSAPDRDPATSLFGLVGQQTITYDDHAKDGKGHPGSVRVTTLRSILTPSEASLRDEVQSRVADWAKQAGVRIDSRAVSGEREMANEDTSLYFVFNGSVTQASGFFNKNAKVKILGEVFQCRQARTSVVIVALAQVTNARSVTGIPLASSPDATTWQEIVADPDGTIDGIKGNRGIAYNVACR